MKLSDYLLQKNMIDTKEFMYFAEATNAIVAKLGIKGLDIEVLE